MARGARWRLIAVVLLFAALLAVAWATGLLASLDAQRIHALVDEAGIWGIAFFLAAFCVGGFLHLPGSMFVVGACLAFGPSTGSAVAFASGVISVSLTFVVIRAIGGRALETIERPWLKKMLAKLEARPILTMIVLRTFLWWSPSLNYTLALTRIRFRDYFIGSMLGLVAPVLALTFAADLFL